MGSAEGFAGARYEDQGDVGEFLTEKGELGEEVAAYAAGSWGVLDYIGGKLFSGARTKGAQRNTFSRTAQHVLRKSFRSYCSLREDMNSAWKVPYRIITTCTVSIFSPTIFQQEKQRKRSPQKEEGKHSQSGQQLTYNSYVYLIYGRRHVLILVKTQGESWIENCPIEFGNSELRMSRFSPI